MANYKTYYVVLLLACGISLALTPLIMRLAMRMGVMDQPGTRKVHHRAVPLMGGLAVAAGMWLPVVALFFYDNLVSAAIRQKSGVVLQILLSGLAMLMVGFIDDLRGLNARQKLVAQVPIALVLVFSGIQFERITLPGIGAFDLGFLGPTITIFWLIGITNAINLVDGIDGLAAGVAMFAAGTNAMIAILNGNVVAAVLMTSLAGGCLGFLRYNFSPARIFLGDTGSLFLGMTLAVSALLTSQKGALATSLLIPVLVLGFPIVDTLLAMTRRMVRGKSMFSGDAGHIHHRLLAHGLNHRQTALSIYGVCALCGLVALVTVLQNSLGMALGFAGLFFVLYVGMRSLGYATTIRTLINSPERLRFKSLYHCAEMTKCKLGLAESEEQVLEVLQALCREFEKPGFAMTRPERPGRSGRDFKWFINQGNGPTKNLASEAHEFTDTGLKFEFYFVPRGNDDELHLEKRNLLGAIAEAANQRVAELAATDKR